MGVNVVAIGNHNLSVEDLDELSRKVEKFLPKNLSDNFYSNYIGGINPKEQKWFLSRDPEYISLEDEWKQKGEIEFDGSYGYSLFLGLKTFSISCGLRYYIFLNEKDLQNEVRQNFYKILKSIGGTKMLYVPDSSSKYEGLSCYVSLGYSIEEIEAQVSSEIGSLSDIRYILKKFPDVCFVDTFNDGSVK